MRDVEAKGARLEDTPMVIEFIDVLPKELPRFPLKRKFEFCIDLFRST